MNFSKIIKIFNQNKIKDYDFLYIYSDFRYFLLKHKNEPLRFIENFIEYFLSNNVTIIVPSFSYSKIKFEIDKTPSSLGFFSNYILQKKQSIRSEHPIFSYAAMGKKRNIIKSVGYSAFGKDSLHARLLYNNACFLNIGRPLIKGNTLVHHVEQNYNAKYRYDKKFKSIVYNKNKKISSGKYSAYVRHLNYKSANKFTFKKVLKKLKKEKFIKNYGEEELYNNINIYPYDVFYFKLHQYYYNDKNIFIRYKINE